MSLSKTNSLNLVSKSDNKIGPDSPNKNTLDALRQPGISDNKLTRLITVSGLVVDD